MWCFSLFVDIYTAFTSSSSRGIMMRYTQAHVYILSPFVLSMCKDIPWNRVDSLLTSFSSHDPGDYDKKL